MMCMVKKGDGLNLKCLCSNNHKMRICEKTHAADKYIDTKYCHKLATPIYRPVNTACREDIECDEGLYCHVVEGENEGECRTCDKDTVFYCTKWEKEKTISPELSKWGTCPFNSQSCPFDCAHEKGGKCNSKKDCCRGMKCDQGKCIDDPCKKTGDCNSDVTCCPGYGCFNASVAYAAGQICTSNTNCAGGTTCNTGTRLCTERPSDPTVIYKPVNYDCKEHTDCDVGLYCLDFGHGDHRGKCFACPPSKCEECAAKKDSYGSCKHGEYNCPIKCATLNEACEWHDLHDTCCRGLKCVDKKCAENLCKRTGHECLNDDECCPNYGCMFGMVVYAEGQNCTKSDEKFTCTDGTKCHDRLNVCYRPKT